MVPSVSALGGREKGAGIQGLLSPGWAMPGWQQWSYNRHNVTHRESTRLTNLLDTATPVRNSGARQRLSALIASPDTPIIDVVGGWRAVPGGWWGSMRKRPG